ncbi:MAG: ABC transporter permease [Saprospiraceae bacterium]|nr:ABC transporter permease [Saprospiraceae bacterium]
MTKKTKKIKKPALDNYLAIAWLALLIFFTFFTFLFPEPSDNSQISFNPPSNGYNDLFIYNQYNNESESIQIDSLKYQLLDEYNNVVRELVLWKSEYTVSILHNQIKKIPFYLSADSLYNIKSSSHRRLMLFGYEDPFADSNSPPRFISFNNEKIFTLEYDSKENCNICNLFKADLEGSSSVPSVLKGKSLLGNDPDGKSILSLIIYGTRYVVRIIFFSLLISLLLAIPVAFYRGFFENRLANILDAFVNFINSIPVYYLVIIVAVLFNHQLLQIIIAIAVVQWIEMEKLIYNQVCKIKKADFIKSARMIGKSSSAIIFTEILPLCWDQILISTFFLAKRIVLIEATLSYLGFSASNEYYGTWGKIISSVSVSLKSNYAAHIILFPLLMIIITLVSLNSIEKFLRRRKNYA